MLPAALPAVLCGGLAVILSSLYFGSWTVWEEWFGVVLGPNRVGRPTRIGDHYTRGNYSTPLLLGFWLDLDVWTAASLLVTALAISMILAVGLTLGADASARAGRVRHVLTRVLGMEDAADSRVLAGVASVLGAIALAACYLPARRALQVTPSAALREE